jgi:ParB-like chromosome segregation protein Spo0J
VQVDLIPLEILRPHEFTIPKKVDELEKMTNRWKAYVLPLVVDKNTGVILDGHHRHQVALRLDLKCLPCVQVDYQGDDSVELDVWPNCGRESITKEEVVQAGLQGGLFQPKTSRHRLSDHLPPISVSLTRLLQAAF